MRMGLVIDMDIIQFADQEAFHAFLNQHSLSEQGIWIRFEKGDVCHKLTSQQALETALCFGWIDGQIKKESKTTYLKYFTKRRKNSIWSTRNKKLATDLIAMNKMQEAGFKQIELAKKDGRWEKADTLPLDYSLLAFEALIKEDKKAFSNWKNMSPSIQKTYAISYYILKKPESRNRRLQVIINRLQDNLHPM